MKTAKKPVVTTAFTVRDAGQAQYFLKLKTNERAQLAAKLAQLDAEIAICDKFLNVEKAENEDAIAFARTLWSSQTVDKLLAGQYVDAKAFPKDFEEVKSWGSDASPHWKAFLRLRFPTRAPRFQAGDFVRHNYSRHDDVPGTKCGQAHNVNICSVSWEPGLYSGGDWRVNVPGFGTIDINMSGPNPKWPNVTYVDIGGNCWAHPDSDHGRKHLEKIEALRAIGGQI